MNASEWKRYERRHARLQTLFWSLAFICIVVIPVALTWRA